MAKPQKENGHLDLANELVEKLAQTQLSGYESRLLWVIWRKTYCWHKKEDWISYSQFQELTKIGNFSHISRGLKKLVLRQIITKNGNKYGLNKNHEEWKELPKMVTKKQLPKLVGELPILDKKLPILVEQLPKLAHTKETKQKKLTKETITNTAASAESANEINQIFKIFYDTINPTINFGNKTQQDACQFLINKFGLERIVKFTQFACSVQNQKFAPVITTPYQLKEKLTQLKIFYERQGKGSKKIGDFI